MRMTPMVARCLSVMIVASPPLPAQGPGAVVVATTSQGRVPAVASASLTYPSDHVLEQTQRPLSRED